MALAKLVAIDAIALAPAPMSMDRAKPDFVQVVRNRGSPKLSQADAYQATLSKEEADRAARGCHKIYLDECCVGCSYHVNCGSCLWSPTAVCFDPCCVVRWPLVCYCRDDSGGWSNKAGALLQVLGHCCWAITLLEYCSCCCGMHLRVVDAERGTLAMWNQPDDGPWCWYVRWTGRP